MKIKQIKKKLRSIRGPNSEHFESIPHVTLTEWSQRPLENGVFLVQITRLKGNTREFFRLDGYVMVEGVALGLVEDGVVQGDRVERVFSIMERTPEEEPVVHIDEPIPADSIERMERVSEAMRNMSVPQPPSPRPVTWSDNLGETRPIYGAPDINPRNMQELRDQLHRAIEGDATAQVNTEFRDTLGRPIRTPEIPDITWDSAQTTAPWTTYVEPPSNQNEF